MSNIILLTNQENDQKLDKYGYIIFNQLEAAIIIIIRGQKCESDKKPSKGNYDNRDIQLIQKNYL